MKKIKIAISGIGAVGGYYGGLLAARYKDADNISIYFISRGENLQAIRSNGLEIKEPQRNILAVPALVTDNPAEIGPVDYLFCCTKSYDLEKNLTQLLPVISPETVIIPFLNGANISEQIQQLLPDSEVWKGCVYIGARLMKPGFVDKYSLKDRLVFGCKTGDKPSQEQLQQILIDAGIHSINPEDIDLEIWKKFFMISTAATITSYFNKPIGEVLENHTDQFIALGNELERIAKAKGIALPENYTLTSIELQKMLPPHSTTSMHTDFIKGNRTEVETLTGYVIQTATDSGIEVPTYQLMYEALRKRSH